MSVQKENSDLIFKGFFGFCPVTLGGLSVSFEDSEHILKVHGINESLKEVFFHLVSKEDERIITPSFEIEDQDQKLYDSYIERIIKGILDNNLVAEYKKFDNHLDHLEEKEDRLFSNHLKAIVENREEDIEKIEQQQKLLKNDLNELKVNCIIVDSVII